jgi:hypothetical protein
MNRVAAIITVLCVGLVSPLAAQDWAKKMFAETKHDFGTVAKNAQTEFRFDFTNLYRDDVHIASVRTSCGCTTPIVTNKTVKSLDHGEVIAHFNTDKFIGQRGATLTVVIDRPLQAEVQLRVDGNIRNDVQVRPGVVNFGSVTQGTPLEQTVVVDYTGSGTGNWQVTGVRSDSPYLETKVLQPTTNSRRTFSVFVRLKDDAPPGYLQDQVTVLTNDPSTPEVPVQIAGRVLPEVTVSPTTLVLGAVPLTTPITRTFVVQAKKPFKVTNIVCDDPGLQATSPTEEAKSWHVISMTFTPKEAGKISGLIRIETDLGKSATTTVPVYVDVTSLATK